MPLFSHLPPASIAVSLFRRLLSMKCFWMTWAAPPAPIVVTAPQYSHTTRASPEDGFIGPPQELHLKLCGNGGGATAWTGAAGLYGWPPAPPGRPGACGRPGWGPCAGTTTPCFAPHKLQNTDPSAILPPHWLQNRGNPPIRTGHGSPVLLKNSHHSFRVATLGSTPREPRDHPHIRGSPVARMAPANPNGTSHAFPDEDVPSGARRPIEPHLPLLRHVRHAGRSLRGRRGHAARDVPGPEGRLLERPPLRGLSARRDHDRRVFRSPLRPDGAEADPRARAPHHRRGGLPVHPEHRPADAGCPEAVPRRGVLRDVRHRGRGEGRLDPRDGQRPRERGEPRAALRLLRPRDLRGARPRIRRGIPRPEGLRRGGGRPRRGRPRSRRERRHRAVPRPGDGVHAGAAARHDRTPADGPREPRHPKVAPRLRPRRGLVRIRAQLHGPPDRDGGKRAAVVAPHHRRVPRPAPRRLPRLQRPPLRSGPPPEAVHGPRPRVLRRPLDPVRGRDGSVRIESGPPRLRVAPHR